MATRRTDVELVKGVLVREDDCFEELIERYASKVLNLALRITRCQEDAEEIMRECKYNPSNELNILLGNSRDYEFNLE